MQRIQADTQAWRLFLRAHSLLVAQLEQEMAEATGLPLSWYDVLAHLQAAPGRRMRLQQLGRSLVISKSGLTRRIDRMVEAGLVVRQECPEDRRGAFVALLPGGEAALEDARPVHRRGIERHFLDVITPEEAATMEQAFARLTEAAEDGSGPACTDRPVEADCP